MSSINSILLDAASTSDEVQAQSECRPVVKVRTNTRAMAAVGQCDGERVRVHIEGRKMSVPGMVLGHTLVTNWGLQLDLTQEPVTRIDFKNHNNGRWEEAYSFAA